MKTTAPPHYCSKDTISHWLVECIKLSGNESLCVCPIRAHDTRALSTSCAFFNGVPLEQILKAAFWSNPNSFIACYLKDVVAHETYFVTASFGHFGLGPYAFREGFPWSLSLKLKFISPPALFLFFGSVLLCTVKEKEQVIFLKLDYDNLHWLFLSTRE